MTDGLSCLAARLDRCNLHLVETAPIEIAHETWLCIGFEERGVDRGDDVHLAMVRSPLIERDPPNLSSAVIAALEGTLDLTVRLHSQCLLSEAFGSTLCDCSLQLNYSFDCIRKRGTGVVLYLRQEGRGLGMRRKLRCLALQAGYVGGHRKALPHTPDEANIALGHAVDERSYDAAAAFLKAVGPTSINLITGNPDKIAALQAAGLAARAVSTPSFAGMSRRARLEFDEKLGRRYNYPEPDGFGLWQEP